MDADDLAQVTDSLRRAVTVDAAGARQAVEEFGWHELLAEEPSAAVGPLFTIAGEHLLDGSFLDDVLVAASGGAVPDGCRLVLPSPGRARPTSRLAPGGQASVDGLAQRTGGPLVVACLDAEERVVLVGCGDLEPEAGDVLDSEAGWAIVRADGTSHQVFLDADGADLWAAMAAAGRRALAYELVGVGSAMVAMTVEHVKTREQFGRALGSFQAVKHQLADVHLWQQVARLSADASWEDGGPQSAALAKAAACRFSRSARTVCQQLLGGMGFTWEHDFHRYLRRALTLEPLLGDAVELHAELGAALRSGLVADSLAAL